MLQCSNLAYSVKGKTLLSDINLAFPEKQLHLIIGANGAGKSTLIKLLSKQIVPTRGSVMWQGKNLNTYSLEHLAKTRSVLSQQVDLVFPLKVHEVVMMGRYPHFTVTPQNTDEQVCQETMRFFDVEKMADRNFLSLSGGEQQRVHFARVCSQIWPSDKQEHKLLFLDEPLTFLDIYYQHQFMQLVRQLISEQNITVIGVVHDLNLAMKFADSFILLNKGKLLAKGNKNEVFTKENIFEAFGIKPFEISFEKNRASIVF